MGNKFVSWLEHIGKAILHIAESREVATAVQLFAPQLGSAFNLTVNACAMAEQKWAALGKQNGTGEQKLADVLLIAKPVIAQALADIGKPNDDAAVEKYVNSVVAVLNAAPAPIVG